MFDDVLIESAGRDKTKGRGEERLSNRSFSFLSPTSPTKIDQASARD